MLVQCIQHALPANRTETKACWCGADQVQGEVDDGEGDAGERVEPEKKSGINQIVPLRPLAVKYHKQREYEGACVGERVRTFGCACAWRNAYNCVGARDPTSTAASDGACRGRVKAWLG